MRRHVSLDLLQVPERGVAQLAAERDLLTVEVSFLSSGTHFLLQSRLADAQRSREMIQHNFVAYAVVNPQSLLVAAQVGALGTLPRSGFGQIGVELVGEVVL